MVIDCVPLAGSFRFIDDTPSVVGSRVTFSLSFDAGITGVMCGLRRQSNGVVLQENDCK